MTSTHCPYCALQCGMNLRAETSEVALEGNPAFPVNRGQLCVKGFTAARLLDHPDRLRTPLIRSRTGELKPASWDDALDAVARQLQEIQRAHGRGSVGVFGSGALTNEKAYLLGKFARVALRTPHIDYNGRFCMSSAAAASRLAFGLDRGLPFPVEDIRGAEVVMLVGSNVHETMPPLMAHLENPTRQGGLIVVDPRKSQTAVAASMHLKITPGSDGALAYGLLHVLIRDGLLNQAFIRDRTTGFEAARALAMTFWPDRVERITGVSEATLTQAAHRLARARAAMILTGRGPEQQSQGVANTLAFINVALALGLPGRPNSGYGCLTGQGNGQGGREHGQKSDQLPGYRSIEDAEARRHVASVWGVGEESLPGPGTSAYELLTALGEDVHALLVVGANVVVSAPNAGEVARRLATLKLLVVSDFFLSETAALAHVVLPSAQWAEEDGTLTNLEGRVIRRRAARPPPEGVRSDLDVLCELAARLGQGDRFRFAGAEDVFNELRRASAGGPADYSGISYEKIDARQGVFWPCPDDSHPGTPRPFANGFATPDGRAHFHAWRPKGIAEEPDASFPLFLTTGRHFAHYQSGTQTRRVQELATAAPEATAQIHPATAQRYGIKDGERVTLATRRGVARFKAAVTRDVGEDTVFVPFHWGGEQSVNLLTHPALDPTSRMPEFKVCAVRVVVPDGA